MIIFFLIMDMKYSTTIQCIDGLLDGSCLQFYLFWSRLHCIHLPRTKAKGQAPEHNWAINNPGFHPVSTEPPLSNTICRDLYNRMPKMERILSTFTQLSLHLTGLLKIPIKTFSM